MLKRRKAVNYLICLLAIVAVYALASGILGHFPGFNAVGEPWDIHGSDGRGILTSQSSISSIRATMDLAEEAKSKGFNVTAIPQQLFTTFEVIGKGMPVARIPVPLFGNTAEGVVYVHTILPTTAPKGGASVFIWKNGQQIQLSRSAKGDSDISVQVPLDKGPNYLSFLVKSGNQWWGRSRVLRVESPGVEEKKDPPAVPSSDFWDEANSKGYNMPKKDSVMGFLGHTVTGRGNVITQIPQPLSGSTGEGVVDSNLRLPTNLAGANNSVYLWNNGEETLINRSARSGISLLGKLVLARGNNYVCATVKNGGRYVGRSPMMRISSSITASIARFEMTWDGSGDMDLHLDDEAHGWHVSYMNTNVDQGGYRANLDVDNMSGFGPENIRVFSLPAKTALRCFVNYYSGGSNLNVTIRQFDKSNKVVKTVSKNFTPGMSQGTPAFNNNSWVVGSFDIEP